jgi:hypothetical protein
MNETTTLQQELNFRLSLLRLVTNAPFAVSPEIGPSAESRQLETMYALVENGARSRG